MSDSITRTNKTPALPVTPSLQDAPSQASSSRKGGPSAQPSRQEEDKTADFENFLNQTSTTAVTKPHKTQQSDAADLISTNSVYLPPTAFPS